MYELDFSATKFAVVGLGETGISIINCLKYYKANIVKVFDTRVSPPLSESTQDLDLVTGPLDFAEFKDIDIIVVSPGVSIKTKALQECIRHGIKVIGDVELFAILIRNWSSKIIGITGTNGKTTVTSLTSYLAKNLGLTTMTAGNIGPAVLKEYLDIIVNNKPVPELIVLELSSFQLETLYSLTFDAATVLNVTPDHLDRYRDVLEYANSKSNIFDNCKMQVLNLDDSLCRLMSRNHEAQLWFSLYDCYSYTKDATHNSLLHPRFTLQNHKEELYLSFDKHNLINTREVSLIGKHNYANILASLALLHAIGINILNDTILNSLKDFVSPSHRMQKIGTIDGITYIEDSKGTNVGAVIAGISGLDQPVHLILGGDGKGQDFSPLTKLVEDKCKSVAIIGKDKELIFNVISSVNIPIKCFDTLEEAVKFLQSNATSNEYIVLSPACASWDMFNDYTHRARVFTNCILG